MADFSELQALLAGMRTPQTPTAPPVTATTPFANIQNLFSGGDITPMVRSIGGGMASIQQGHDPYVAFAQGFGGSQNYSSEAAKTAADAAAKAKQDEFDNALALNNALINQDSNQAQLNQDQTQHEEQMELRRAAEERQRKMDELQFKKTEAEIKRMADSNGLTTNQMLEIERIAQAEGEGYVSPTERKAAVDRKRQELLSQFQTQGSMNQSTNTGVPSVGDVVDGYVFEGGDPSNPESWKQQ